MHARCNKSRSRRPVNADDKDNTSVVPSGPFRSANAPSRVVVTPSERALSAKDTLRESSLIDPEHLARLIEVGEPTGLAVVLEALPLSGAISAVTRELMRDYYYTDLDARLCGLRVRLGIV